jgi:hypothetical protein
VRRSSMAGVARTAATTLIGGLARLRLRRFAVIYDIVS